MKMYGEGEGTGVRRVVKMKGDEMMSKRCASDEKIDGVGAENLETGGKGQKERGL